MAFILFLVLTVVSELISWVQWIFRFGYIMWPIIYKSELNWNWKLEMCNWIVWYWKWRKSSKIWWRGEGGVLARWGLTSWRQLSNPEVVRVPSKWFVNWLWLDWSFQAQNIVMLIVVCDCVLSFQAQNMDMNIFIMIYTLL